MGQNRRRIRPQGPQLFADDLRMFESASEQLQRIRREAGLPEPRARRPQPGEQPPQPDAEQEEEELTPEQRAARELKQRLDKITGAQRRTQRRDVLRRGMRRFTRLSANLLRTPEFDNASGISVAARSERGVDPDRTNNEDAYYTLATGFSSAEFDPANPSPRAQESQLLNVLTNMSFAEDGEVVPDEEGINARKAELTEELHYVENQLRAYSRAGIISGLEIVADGMGGQGSGEAASSLSTYAVMETIVDLVDDGAPVNEDLLRQAAMEASRKVQIYNTLNAADSNSTLTIILRTPTETFALPIGDSRVYKQSPDGTVVCMSTDSTVAMTALVADPTRRPSEYFQMQGTNVLSESVARLNADQIRIQKLGRLSRGEKIIVTSDGVPSDVEGFHDGEPISPQLKEILDRIDKEYAEALKEVSIDASPDEILRLRQEQVRIAFGKMFREVNLAGLDAEVANSRENGANAVAEHLLRNHGQFSGDNLTAVVIQSRETRDQLTERRTEAQRNEFVGGAPQTEAAIVAQIQQLNAGMTNPIAIPTQEELEALRAEYWNTRGKRPVETPEQTRLREQRGRGPLARVRERARGRGVEAPEEVPEGGTHTLPVDAQTGAAITANNPNYDRESYENWLFRRISGTDENRPIHEMPEIAAPTQDLDTPVYGTLAHAQRRAQEGEAEPEEVRPFSREEEQLLERHDRYDMIEREVASAIELEGITLPDREQLGKLRTYYDRRNRSTKGYRRFLEEVARRQIVLTPEQLDADPNAEPAVATKPKRARTEELYELEAGMLPKFLRVQEIRLEETLAEMGLSEATESEKDALHVEWRRLPHPRPSYLAFYIHKAYGLKQEDIIENLVIREMGHAEDVLEQSGVTLPNGLTLQQIYSDYNNTPSFQIRYLIFADYAIARIADEKANPGGSGDSGDAGAGSGPDPGEPSGSGPAPETDTGAAPSPEEPPTNSGPAEPENGAGSGVPTGGEAVHVESSPPVAVPPPAPPSGGFQEVDLSPDTPQPDMQREREASLMQAEAKVATEMGQAVLMPDEDLRIFRSQFQGSTEEYEQALLRELIRRAGIAQTSEAPAAPEDESLEPAQEQGEAPAQPSSFDLLQQPAPEPPPAPEPEAPPAPPAPETPQSTEEDSFYEEYRQIPSEYLNSVATHIGSVEWVWDLDIDLLQHNILEFYKSGGQPENILAFLEQRHRAPAAEPDLTTIGREVEPAQPAAPEAPPAAPPETPEEQEAGRKQEFVMNAIEDRYRALGFPIPEEGEALEHLREEYNESHNGLEPYFVFIERKFAEQAIAAMRLQKKRSNKFRIIASFSDDELQAMDQTSFREYERRVVSDPAAEAMQIIENRVGLRNIQLPERDSREGRLQRIHYLRDDSTQHTYEEYLLLQRAETQYQEEIEKNVQDFNSPKIMRALELEEARAGMAGFAYPDDRIALRTAFRRDPNGFALAEDDVATHYAKWLRNHFINAVSVENTVMPNERVIPPYALQIYRQAEQTLRDEGIVFPKGFDIQRYELDFFFVYGDHQNFGRYLRDYLEGLSTKAGEQAQTPEAGVAAAPEQEAALNVRPMAPTFDDIPTQDLDNFRNWDLDLIDEGLDISPEQAREMVLNFYNSETPLTEEAYKDHIRQQFAARAAEIQQQLGTREAEFSRIEDQVSDDLGVTIASKVKKSIRKDYLTRLARESDLTYVDFLYERYSKPVSGAKRERKRGRNRGEDDTL